MLFETYQSIFKKFRATKNLKNKRTATLSFFFSLSLTHFGPMFCGSLGISVFWGAYRDQSVYFTYQINVVGFSMSCRIARNVGFFRNVGSSGVNVFVSFIYVNK